MDHTDGFKMVEIKFQGESYNAFYKVTRKGVIIVETRKDIPIKPYDQLTIGVDQVIVQKILVLKDRSEITCEAIASSDIIKANKTLKKLKKSEQGKDKNTDGEQV